MPRLRVYLIALSITVVALAVDQASKQVVRHTLMRQGFLAHDGEYPACGTPEQEDLRDRFVAARRRTQHVIPGFFSLRYVENCSSAFGGMSFLPSPLRFPLLIGAALAAAILCGFFLRRVGEREHLLIASWALFLGGALGNLADRFVYRYVIDFLDFHLLIGRRVLAWPTFNVADVAIALGAMGLILHMFRSRRSGGRRAEGEEPAQEAERLDHS